MLSLRMVSFFLHVGFVIPRILPENVDHMSLMKGMDSMEVTGKLAEPLVPFTDDPNKLEMERLEQRDTYDETPPVNERQSDNIPEIRSFVTDEMIANEQQHQTGSMPGKISYNDLPLEGLMDRMYWINYATPGVRGQAEDLVYQSKSGQGHLASESELNSNSGNIPAIEKYSSKDFDPNMMDANAQTTGMYGDRMNPESQLKDTVPQKFLEEHIMKEDLPKSRSRRHVYYSKKGTQERAAKIDNAPQPIGSRIVVELEPSFSHDSCEPARTHVLFRATAYIPTTIYNTHHLVVPSTLYRQMAVTRFTAFPVVFTSTITSEFPQEVAVSTAIVSSSKALVQNDFQTTTATKTVTKVHIFTKTKDYFWTKTETVPQVFTNTATVTSQVSRSDVAFERRTKYIYATVTQQVTRRVATTLYSTTHIPVLATQVANQYRYVTATGPATTVAATHVTSTDCRRLLQQTAAYYQYKS